MTVGDNVSCTVGAYYCKRLVWFVLHVLHILRSYMHILFSKNIFYFCFIDTTERWIVPHVFLIHHSYTFPAFLKIREKFMEHFCEHRQILVVRVIQSPWSTNSWSLAKKTASMTIGTFNTIELFTQTKCTYSFTHTIWKWSIICTKKLLTIESADFYQWKIPQPYSISIRSSRPTHTAGGAILILHWNVKKNLLLT